MRETLPTALRLIFGHEGGYANAPTDKGGPTKYGITHATLAAHRGVTSISAAQVKALTLAEAEAIYRKSYWTQSGGDALPVGLDFAAFDFGINSGPGTAVRVLQQVIGVTSDGKIGPKTLAAVNAYPGGTVKLIRDYCAARMTYLRSLTNPKTGFPANGRGWTIRVTGVDPKGEWASKPGVVGQAVRLAMDAAPSPRPPEKPVIMPSDPVPTVPPASLPPAAWAAIVVGLLIAAVLILDGATLIERLGRLRDLGAIIVYSINFGV